VGVLEPVDDRIPWEVEGLLGEYLLEALGIWPRTSVMPLDAVT